MPKHKLHLIPGGSFELRDTRSRDEVADWATRTLNLNTPVVHLDVLIDGNHVILSVHPQMLVGWGLETQAEKSGQAAFV